MRVPEYRSIADWQGLKVEVRDASKWRRGLFRLKNYHVLDTPSLEVEVTTNPNYTSDFPEISFEQTVRQGTLMSPIKHIPTTDIKNGRRFNVPGRQVKEQEDYRIDLVARHQTIARKSVIFQATILSKDARRKDMALLIWGAIFGLVGAIIVFVLGLAMEFVQIVPFWELRLTP